MDVVNLVGITRFCKESGISRATFYRRLHREEFEVYRVPGSKRLWIAPCKNKAQVVNEFNVLKFLETEPERVADMLERFDAEKEKEMERLSKVSIV